MEKMRIIAKHKREMTDRNGNADVINRLFCHGKEVGTKLPFNPGAEGARDLGGSIWICVMRLSSRDRERNEIKKKKKMTRRDLHSTNSIDIIT